MARDATYNQRTARQICVDIIIGNKQRTSVVTTQLQKQITNKSLTSFNTSTFGFLNDAVGDNRCSVSGTALTSPDNPWTVDDVGKNIELQGAGVAGATHATTIAAFVSAGAVTLTAAAPTAVTETATSAGGIGIWGWSPDVQRQLTPLINSSNQPLDSDLVGAVGAQKPILRYINDEEVADVPKGPVTTSGLTMNTARVLGRITAANGAIEEITVGSGLTLAAGSLTANPTTLVNLFSARVGAGQAVTNDVTDVIFSTEDFDASGVYNNATGVFTAPATGTYLFIASLDTDAGATFYIGFFKNGTDSQRGSGVLGGPSTGSYLVNLTVGDTVTVRVNRTCNVFGPAERNMFAGMRVA